jgi:uncharacterized protein (DUF2062 family)
MNPQHDTEEPGGDAAGVNLARTEPVQESSPSGPKKASLLKRMWMRVRGAKLTPRRGAGSVAIGLFVGCTPLYGLHFPICAALCFPKRLNIAVAYGASQISNPLFAPFIVALELVIGGYVLGRPSKWGAVDMTQIDTLLLNSAQEVAVGALLVGSILATLGALTTFFVLSRTRRNDALAVSS